ncbi:unnamed protein product [Closterium sp. NIES-65]|nr:unnamed protein product [Closterium sp. NIES-65]
MSWRGYQNSVNGSGSGSGGGWNGSAIPPPSFNPSAPPADTSAPVCYSFLSPAGCRFGHRCRFSHSAPPQSLPAFPPTHSAFPPSHSALPQSTSAFPPTHSALPHSLSAFPPSHSALPQPPFAFLPNHSALPQSISAGAHREGQAGAGGACVRVSVMSYNVLASCHAAKFARELYPGVPKGVLHWSQRRHGIVKEIKQHSPDLICLQEVDNHADLCGALNKLGYDSIFQCRTGGNKDGCANFWNTKRCVPPHVCPMPGGSHPTCVPCQVCPTPRVFHARCVPPHVCPIPFICVLSLHTAGGSVLIFNLLTLLWWSCVDFQSIEFAAVGLRDNVALLTVLKFIGENKEGEGVEELEEGEERDEENSSCLVLASIHVLFNPKRGDITPLICLVLANIHVLFNPKRGDIKLAQMSRLLSAAHQLSEKHGSCPVVVCGDFNATPAVSMVSGQLEGGEGQQQVRFQSASHLNQHWSTEQSGASETTTSATTATTTSTTTATTTAATTISSITAEGSANGGLTSGSFVSISEAKRQRVAVNENGQEGMGALGNDGSGWGGSTFALASGGLGWGGMGGMGGVGGMGRMGRMGGWSFEELRIATGSDGVDTVVKHPLKLKSAYSQAPGVLDVLLAFHPHPTLRPINHNSLHPSSPLLGPLHPSSPLFAPLHPSTPRHPS